MEIGVFIPIGSNGWLISDWRFNDPDSAHRIGNSAQAAIPASPA